MTLPIKQADAEVLLEYAGKVLGIMGGPGALNDWLERIPPGAESDSDEKVIEDCTAFLVREAGGDSPHVVGSIIALGLALLAAIEDSKS